MGLTTVDLDDLERRFRLSGFIFGNPAIRFRRVDTPAVFGKVRAGNTRRLDWADCHYCRVEVIVEFDVRDRDTGRPIRLTTPHDINGFELLRMLDAPDGERFLARVVLDVVNRAVQHEAAEAFEFDGVRVFDPHQDDEARPKPPRPSPRP